MPPSFTLRAATSADIGALDDLFQRSYTRLLAADYPPSVLVTAIPVIARAQPDLVTSGLFYVAERKGALIGAGGWSLSAPGGRPGMRGQGHIRHVATAPDAIRQGVGRALLDHIMFIAKASGMAQMQCQSTRTAVPFYTAMGFDTKGEVSISLRGGIAFPAMLMNRIL